MNTKRPCIFCGKKTKWHRCWIVDELESDTAENNPVHGRLILVEDHFKVHGFVCDTCEKKVNEAIGKALADIESMKSELTEELKKEINEMDYESMLRLNRFAPPGHPMFIGEVGEYFLKVMYEKKTADPEGAVRASKSIGWER